MIQENSILIEDQIKALKKAKEDKQAYGEIETEILVIQDSPLAALNQMERSCRAVC